MSVPYAPVAWGTEAARRTFGPVGAYMGPYTAGRTVATCDDMGWRRGRACVAFCSAWCSVLVAPLRQWGGALGSGVAWTVLVVWVGVSALRLWAEWPGYDERTTASLHTSLVAATSHIVTSTKNLDATKRFALTIVAQHNTGGPASEPCRGPALLTFGRHRRTHEPCTPMHVLAETTPPSRAQEPHAHCPELPALLPSFTRILACLAHALYFSCIHQATRFTDDT